MRLRLFDPIEKRMLEVSKNNKTVKRMENKDIYEVNSCKVFTFSKRFVTTVNEQPCSYEQNM